MKIKQKNEETGEEEEIEVASIDEVDAKVKEAEDKIKAEYDSKISEKDTELTKAAEEKQALQDKIAGVKEDHPNFKVLKDALTKKDEEIKSIRTDLDTDRSARKEAFADNIIGRVSKGNQDIEKKIKFHMENTVVGMKDGTEAEHKSKLEAAIKLASDNSQSMNIMDGIMEGVGGRGMGGTGNSGGEKVEFTAREKGLGAKLGITPEDYKKYGSRVSKR